MASARKKLTLDEMLDMVERRAIKLRGAGVLKFTYDGFTAELAPLPAAPLPPQTEADEEDPPAPAGISDPLRDPATYPGGRMPRSLYRDDTD